MAGRATKSLSAHRIGLTLRALALVVSLALAGHFAVRFHAGVLTTRASLWAARGEWGRAEAAGASALRLNPADGLACYYLGVSRAAQGRFAQAHDDLTRAAALMRNGVLARFTLAEVLAGQGRFDRAVPLLEAALTLNPRPRQRPDHFWALLDRCRVGAGSGVETSVAPLWMALALGGEAPSLLNRLAASYRVLGHATPQLPDALTWYAGLMATGGPDRAGSSRGAAPGRVP